MRLALVLALSLVGVGCGPAYEPSDVPLAEAAPVATLSPTPRPETSEMGEVARCVGRCREGDAPSCNNLGAMSELGRGVEQDEARALTLYDDACARSAQAACFNAERLRVKERAKEIPIETEPPAPAATDPNACSTHDECKKRCEGGDEVACHNLSGIHIQGNVQIEGNVKMFGDVYLYGH